MNVEYECLANYGMDFWSIFWPIFRGIGGKGGFPNFVGDPSSEKFSCMVSKLTKLHNFVQNSSVGFATLKEITLDSLQF